MGGTSFAPDLEAWDAWPPSTLGARLASLRVPWAVAGGWAIDLHLGMKTRPHADIEIAVPRDHIDDVVDCLDELEWFAIGDGLAWPLADAPQQLHQTWGRDRGERWRLDVLREPWDGQDWVFRRDRRIRRPLAAAIESSSGGIPYLAPETVLLFKAQSQTEKDEADFERTIPTLTHERMEWLRRALETVEPTNTWITRLGGASK